MNIVNKQEITKIARRIIKRKTLKIRYSIIDTTQYEKRR